MKIKIIDLLNKIANGEDVPEKIKYKNLTFIKRNSGDYMSKSNIYITEFLVEAPNIKGLFNEEVEIVEEDKPIEELKEIQENNCLSRYPNNKELMNKINELVKEINKFKKTINKMMGTDKAIEEIKKEIDKLKENK